MDILGKGWGDFLKMSLVDQVKFFSATCCKVLYLSLLLFGGCKEEDGGFESYKLPNQVVRDFELDESVSGRRLYRLSARLATVWEDESRIDVETLEVIFYGYDEQPYSRLVADAGTVWIRGEDLVARGHVFVITGDSMTLRTDSLAWSNSRRLIHTQAGIVIETSQGQIAGTGLVADAQLNKIEILSEVHGSSNYEFEP